MSPVRGRGREASGVQRVSPALCSPRWLEGRAQGRDSVPLLAQLGLELTQAPASLVGDKKPAPTQLPLLTTPPTPKHTPEKARRTIQYLPPPALAWLLQRKREQSPWRTPEGRTPPHMSCPSGQGDGTRDRTATHPPEVPAGGRGPPLAPSRPSSSPGASSTNRWSSGPPEARGPQRVRPAAHEGPGFLPAPLHRAAPWKTSLEKGQALSVFTAISVSVASDGGPEAEPTTPPRPRGRRRPHTCPPQRLLGSCCSASARTGPGVCRQHAGPSL